MTDPLQAQEQKTRLEAEAVAKLFEINRLRQELHKAEDEFWKLQEALALIHRML